MSQLYALFWPLELRWMCAFLLVSGPSFVRISIDETDNELAETLFLLGRTALSLGMFLPAHL